MSHKYNYYRFIPKDVLVSSEFNECYRMIEKCEKSKISAMFTIFTGKLSKFPDDIRYAAITVWNRKEFSNIYDSVYSTINKAYNMLDKGSPNFEAEDDKIKLSIAFGACLFAFTFIKLGEPFSCKLRIRISDVCRDILCDYCNDPEGAFDTIRETVECLRGVIGEAETMQIIFAGLTAICPGLRQHIYDDGRTFCKEISNLLRKEFERYY